LVVQFSGKKSLYDLVDLQELLENKLKIKVDLLTYKGINPLLKPFVEKHQIKVIWQPLIFILHIKDCLKHIDSHLKGTNKKSFYKSVKTQDAVLRRLEIIGEAANKLPAVFKKKYPEVKWRSIIGARNKLIHEYFGINLDLIWEIIRNDLPILKKQLDKIVKDNEQEVLDLVPKK